MTVVVRSNPSTRRRAADESSTTATTDGGRSSGGRLRKLLVSAGLLAVGYVVARRARSGDLGRSTDELRTKAGEALPGDGRTIPIGGSREDESADPTLGIGATGDEPDASPGSSDEAGAGGAVSSRSTTDEGDDTVGDADDRDDDTREGHA